MKVVIELTVKQADLLCKILADRKKEILAKPHCAQDWEDIDEVLDAIEWAPVSQAE